MVRKLVAGPPPTNYRNLVSTVRDFDGTQIIQLRFEFTNQAIMAEQRQTWAPCLESQSCLGSIFNGLQNTPSTVLGNG